MATLRMRCGKAPDVPCRLPPRTHVISDSSVALRALMSECCTGPMVPLARSGPAGPYITPSAPISRYIGPVGDEDAAGTSLAPGRRMADLAVAGEVWRVHRNRLFLASARRNHILMMLGGGMFQAGVIVALGVGGLETWRLIGLGAAFVVFSGAQRIIVRTLHDPARLDTAFFRVALTAQVFLVTCLALTGGLASPFLASAVLPVVVPLLFFGPHPVTRGLTALWALLMVAVAILPVGVTGMPADRTTYIWAALSSLGSTMFVVHHVFGKIADAAHGAACSIDSLREERMETAEEQHRRLQGVGSKVAHELKNPLAAIKGLVQLVARTPDSERTQERLAVVQAEVSRMETILREYLSFARPLEDLVPMGIDLATVTSDVVAVLAGRLDQGRIAMRLDVRPTPLSADSRRLREALINLMANAVEATPAGGRGRGPRQRPRHRALQPRAARQLVLHHPRRRHRPRRRARRRRGRAARRPPALRERGRPRHRRHGHVAAGADLRRRRPRDQHVHHARGVETCRA